MDINNVIAKAQKLMLDENWNNDVERAAAAQRPKSMNGGLNDGADIAMLEQMAGFGGGASASNSAYYNPLPQNVRGGNTPYNDGSIQILQETATPRNTSNSKLPQAVLQSFNELSPQTTEYANMGMALDEALNFGTQQAAPSMAAVRQIIKETVMACMKQMNENTNTPSFRGMRFCDGNVFQFIDNKGNLYEGTLKLKKRATK